jgi:uncharacterized protein (TIGR00730 family)
MAAVKRLCVYCGSSAAVDSNYRDAAIELGQALAEAGIELVYGGGRVGLMGLLANAVLQRGGQVTGIIPAHLHDYEVGHHGITELIIVDSMHERKRLMFEMSDAFAVLPGGLGTLDETFEIITWKQLALHDRPIIILDEAGYWQPLLQLIDHIIETGFARPTTRGLFRTVPSVKALLAALAESREPALAAESRLI